MHTTATLIETIEWHASYEQVRQPQYDAQLSCPAAKHFVRQRLTAMAKVEGDGPTAGR
jgi:hypothetical protein